jgi:hypothetical protein
MRNFIRYITDDLDTSYVLEAMLDLSKSSKSFTALKNMVSIFGLNY